MLLLAAVSAADTTDVSDVAAPVVAIAAGVVAALVVAAIVGALVRYVGRRSAVAQDLSRRARRPFRVVLIVIGVWVALRLSTEPAPWVAAVEHGLLIALIVAMTWLIGALAFAVEDLVLQKYRVDVPDNRRARRVRTQIIVVRRLTVAISSWSARRPSCSPSRRRGRRRQPARSAGLVSIVAGLAAQTSLANVFAGMQIAFTDAIRVDDVVVVEGEWGRIEEITMTYVVVHVWDDRRLIMPSTYFTTTPFQNWTRRAAELLGTVELDLDWDVPVEAMRDELDRLLEATDLWDERVGILQVTEATGGYVRLRALASAADAPTLFDLRCYVREGLVDWLQEHAPSALPRTRVEGVETVRDAARLPGAAPASGTLGQPEPVTGETGVTVGTGDGSAPVVRRRSFVRNHAGDTQQVELHPRDSRLFTGSFDAIERSRAFSGPGPDVIEEREEAAERADGGPWTGGNTRVHVVGPGRRPGSSGSRRLSAGLAVPEPPGETPAGAAVSGEVPVAPEPLAGSGHSADPEPVPQPAPPAVPEDGDGAEPTADETAVVLPEPVPADPPTAPVRRHVGTGPLPVTPDATQRLGTAFRRPARGTARRRTTNRPGTNRPGTTARPPRRRDDRPPTPGPWPAALRDGCPAALELGDDGPRISRTRTRSRAPGATPPGGPGSRRCPALRGVPLLVHGRSSSSPDRRRDHARPVWVAGSMLAGWT